MATTPTKRSFPPVVDSKTRLLVLGSLPGEQSLAQARYYAHPRNQFWQLMSDVIGCNLTVLDYQDRLDTLLAAHIGLWDVVESATRVGSLDTSIRDHRPNRLAELAASLPRLGAVAFNGNTAARIGRFQLAEREELSLITLPSSSTALTMSLAEKRVRWLALQPWVKKKP